MKFGKHIQAHAHPEWLTQYMNYKGLKKIINAAERNESIYLDYDNSPLISPLSTNIPTFIINNNNDNNNNNNQQQQPEDLNLLQQQQQYRRSDTLTFESAKPLFFKRLDVELQKVNAFYLQKEKELVERIDPIVEKKNVLVNRRGRRLGNITVKSLLDSCHEFQNHLVKLQEFVAINDSGFRKILKKWDKRSKLMMKEVYISRHVEIQPCFNANTLTELADKITSAISELSSMKKATSSVEGSGSLDEFDEDGNDGGDFESSDDLSGRILQDVIALNADKVCVFLKSADRELISKVFYALCVSAKASNEMISLLLQQQPSQPVDVIDYDYCDSISKSGCLHESSKAGNMPCLLHCIKQPAADLSRKDIYGRTCVHYCAMQKNFHFVRAVVEHLMQADQARASDILNAHDQSGMTALSYAVVNGNEDSVRILLERGASLVGSPLCLAIQSGNESIARILIKFGACLSDSNSNGTFPLHIAARTGKTDILKLLLTLDKAEKEVNRKDDLNGWQPIFYCASEGQTECLKELLNFPSCKLNVVDESGWTPQAYAIWHGHEELADTIVGKLQRSSGEKKPVDLAVVPQLFLPPPTIPIYGDKYIGRHTQLIIQMQVGDDEDQQKQFIEFFDSNLASIKVNMIIRRKNGEPFGAALMTSYPIHDSNQLFEFTIDDLQDSYLEIDLYPPFGSRIVGRSVLLLSDLQCTTRSVSREELISGRMKAVCPIIDRNLKTIGVLKFDLMLCINRTGALLPTLNIPKESPDVKNYRMIKVDLGAVQKPEDWKSIHSANFNSINDKSDSGILLDVSLQSEHTQSTSTINDQLEIILNSIYAELIGTKYQRIIFMSNHPVICLFLSLKQPDFPILFNFSKLLNNTCNQIWINSMHSAVKFSKEAGLLGLLCDETPLVQVPDLVRVVKEEGLFLSVYQSSPISDQLEVDGVLNSDGVYSLKNFSVI